MKTKSQFILIIMSLFALISCASKSGSESIKKVPIELRPVEIYYDWDKYQKIDEISFEEMQEDLETFIYIIETSYAGYEDALARGMDTNILRQKILNHFDGQDVINIEDFAKELNETFLPYIQDYHANIRSKNNSYRFITPTITYFGDVYFIKQNDDYFVYESKIPEIKTGEKYESDSQYLFYYPSKGREVYRLGCLSKDKPESLKVSVGKKTYEVPLISCDATYLDFSYVIRETEKSIYFKLTQFYFDNDEQLKALKRFSESADLCRDKEFVIFDVRGNPGGDNSYEQKLIADLYKKGSKIEDYLPIPITSTYSPASIEALTAMINLVSDLNNPDIKQWLKKLARMKKIAEKESVKILSTDKNEKYSVEESSYKGKIIVLTDCKVASSGEDLLCDCEYLFGKTNQIVQIGQNTSGCEFYGNVCQYTLENSGTKVNFSLTDFSEYPKLISNFHGEGNGFYPDIWSTTEDLNDSIFYVTQDKEMYEILKEVF